MTEKQEITGIFADRFTYLMQVYDENYASLSEKIGIPQVTLSYWARQKATASIAGVVRIAKYFHVTTDYLLGVNTDDVVIDTWQRECVRLHAEVEDMKKRIEKLEGMK